MSLSDDLKALGPTTSTVHRGKRYPDGWQPRAEWDEAGGYIVSEPFDPRDTPEDQLHLFELHGLSPEDWVITRARSSRWQTYDERWLEASRIEFAPRKVVQVARADAEAVIKRIAGWRPRAAKTTNEHSFWAPVGDTQIGKIEGGGTPATVERFLDNLELIVSRQRDLRADHVYLPWLGDCIEGVVSQGGKVQGRLDLSITEQVRVYRRLVMAQIKAFAPLTNRITVIAIPGNHDEPSRDLFTKGTDSWALDAISAVQDGVEENPVLSDMVDFYYPSDDTLTVTLDSNDVRVTMAHGHQFPNRKDYWQDWWDGQIRARHLPGDADILLAAHRHHLRVADFAGGRMFIQIPALDGGSQHFDNRSGGGVPSRMVSFTLEEGRIRNFDPVL